MWKTFQETWLPRLLFLATLGTAISLASLVLLAPWLAFIFFLESPLVNLFADDAMVRRTSLGSAVGLAVTAYLCFRPRKPTMPPGT